MPVTWLSESYDHGPEDLERLAAVAAALAAAPLRNVLVVSTADDTTSAGPVLVHLNPVRQEPVTAT